MLKKCKNPNCKNPHKDIAGFLPATSENFYRCSTKKDGLTGKCKFCRAKDQREYINSNKFNFSVKWKQYRDANKEKIALAKQQSYLKNKEHYLQYQKQYREDDSNKSKIRVRKSRYEFNRLRIDLNYRLIRCLRARANKAVKGLAKASATKELIGCSTNELRTYLESKFQPGMSWNNYGQWHIDHIKPCKVFDFTKVEDQKTCFHFSNLQPLWARDNLRKSSKYLEVQTGEINYGSSQRIFKKL